MAGDNVLLPGIDARVNLCLLQPIVTWDTEFPNVLSLGLESDRLSLISTSIDMRRQLVRVVDYRCRKSDCANRSLPRGFVPIRW